MYASRQPDPVLQQAEQEHDLTLSTNDASVQLAATDRTYASGTANERLRISLCGVNRSGVDTGAVTLCLPQDAG